MIAAISRSDIGNYVFTLIQVYTFLIFIRILITWIPRMPYNRYLDAFLRFLGEVTDPYLNLFRRLLPPLRFGGGGIDLSPIVAIFVLQIVGNLIVSAISG